MADIFHECGIAAIYHLMASEVSPLTPEVKNQSPQQHHVSRLLPRMLLDLQNRGQLSSGYSSFHPGRPQILDTYKEIGTVIEAFRLNHPGKSEAILNDHAGHAAIGHVRYATCGPNTKRYAQPFEREHGCKWQWFAFAFNGHLANVDNLRDELQNKYHYHLTRENDTEVIMHLIAHELQTDSPPDLVDVFRRISKKLDGAYNLVFLNALGDMVVLRDPKGIRPLCYAVEGSLFGAASESVALLNIGFSDIRSLEPGELILIQDGQYRIERFAEKQKPAHCFFEWIYFANVASTLDERSVYLTRSRLGQELADQERRLNKVILDEDTIVVPVPDTGKAAADAMAFKLKIPSLEGLMRNRYVGRTFIEGTNRLDRVKMKYTPLREVMEGKRVILVEDSIVRSTTLKTLLIHLRERGKAAEIHVRIACPPILAPCFYGIDLSSVKELFAPRFMNGLRPTDAEQAAMAKDLGADSLIYLPLEAVARCIGLDESQLCRACITGHYPTPKGQELYQLDLLKRDQKAERPTDATAEVCQPLITTTVLPHL